MIDYFENNSCEVHSMPSDSTTVYMLQIVVAAAVSHGDSLFSLSHTSYTVTDPVEVIMLLVATKIIFILYFCVLSIPNPLTFPLALTKCWNLSFPFRIYSHNILHLSIFYPDHKPQTQQLLIPQYLSKLKVYSLIRNSLPVSPLLS